MCCSPSNSHVLCWQHPSNTAPIYTLMWPAWLSHRQLQQEELSGLSPEVYASHSTLLQNSSLHSIHSRWKRNRCHPRLDTGGGIFLVLMTNTNADFSEALGECEDVTFCIQKWCSKRPIKFSSMSQSFSSVCRSILVQLPITFEDLLRWERSNYSVFLTFMDSIQHYKNQSFV